MAFHSCQGEEKTFIRRSTVYFMFNFFATAIKLNNHTAERDIAR